MGRTRTRRSDRLLDAVNGRSQILIVTHDNPDPDAIAGGWVLRLLFRRLLGRSARLVAGGAIVRAENRQFVERLKPPIELVQMIDVESDAAVILVDCGVEAANHLLAGSRVRPLAMIDHHPSSTGGVRLPFRDLRTGVAACASITASYLREQSLEPRRRLATALVYAIRTETRGVRSQHSRLDRSVLMWLSPRADPTWLAQIENAPLSKTYFGDLALALQNTFLYHDAALCYLPRATGAEIVGEVADLLIRSEGVRRVLCGAVVKHDLVISVRTRPGGLDAANLARSVLSGIGGGGGHLHRAGGSARVKTITERTKGTLRDELRRRWLTACNQTGQRGRRLVPRREMMRALA